MQKSHDRSGGLATHRLDFNQLQVVEKFAHVKSFQDGEIIIEAGTRDPNSTS
jgi:hypothetical protein